jgi:hypothetical protein
MDIQTDAILIACKMMEQEIRYSMERKRCSCITEWVDSRFHRSPEKLRDRVQCIIAEHPNHYTFLLALAQCGNAFIGLRSMHATLVLPKFADCIHLLRSFKSGDRGEIDNRTFYLTGDWLKGGNTILAGYRQFEAKHGVEKTQKIYRRIMAEYRHLSMIDTGAYDMCKVSVLGQETAEILGLDYGYVPGTVRVLDDLLSNNWGKEFIVIPPESQIREEDFEISIFGD